MNYDIAEIKNNNPIDQVIAGRIKLTRHGNELKSLCPFHSEKTPSFTVSPAKDFYHCFACLAHGDIIDFIMAYDGVNFTDACKILGGQKKAPSSGGRAKRQAKIIEDVYDGIEPVLDANPPPPKSKIKVWNPKRERWSDYKPVAIYKYTPTAYVLRIEFGDGKKVTPMIMWCKLKDGTAGWCHYTFPSPRPLYGSLGNRKPILIVEGEKTRDAAHKLMGRLYDVITWPGGTNSITKADWKPLAGKNVLIWGDADEPGEKAVIGYREKNGEWRTGLLGLLKAVKVKELKYIPWDHDKPKGWDAADSLSEGWTTDKVIAWAKKRVKVYTGKAEEEPPIAEPPEEEITQQGTLIEDNSIPFKVLGHDHNMFYYFPDQTQQVVQLSPAQHVKNHLMTLANLDYWGQRFPSRTGISWDDAYQALLKLQRKAGYFHGQDSIRGRGAWIDEGRSILHLGTKVYVNNKSYSPKDVPSEYCYEGNINLDIDTAKPATSKEAHQLVKLCESLSWANPLSGALLAGWCIIAPVCGMLDWRPHIWLTGASGTGKSTVIKDICRLVMGKLLIVMQGHTTEAGIRQRLKRDALPVIFDEAESENKLAIQRMQNVLSLARVSSSGGEVAKGTTDGHGQIYTLRSCFLFSSVNVSISEYADDSRISRLTLKMDMRDNADNYYEELKIKMYETFTKEYSEKLLARTMKNLPTLRNNCATFVKAASIVLKSRRIADQIGTILAGTFLCYSTREISIDEAVSWIKKQDWGDHTTINAKRDEDRLIDRIATLPIRVDTSKGMVQSTLGELIMICWRNHGTDSGGIDVEQAERHLRRIGVKVDDEWIYIANKSDPLKALLKDTPWASEWARPLKDTYRAESSGNIVYFAPGIKTRATKVPIKLFME